MKQMKTKIIEKSCRWLVRVSVILSLSAAAVGCAMSAHSGDVPSQLAAVKECEAGKVKITGVHSFREPSGAWRVVGTITNGSSKAVGKIVTGVETLTRTGQPADQGEDVSAYPLDLQPGAQAPFTAWIDREIPGLDHFNVEVDECVLTEPHDRGSVEIHGSQMVVDEAGIAQVTAELFNPGPRPVLVNGLMAAVYDRTGALVTADYVQVATRILDAGESGPVRAALYLPPDGAQRITSYQFFMDTLVNNPNPPALEANWDIKMLSHYTDGYGHFHLLGQITNPGSTGLMAGLQATIYTDSTRSKLADAACLNTWIPLQPGETRPFDLTGWGALNDSPGLWDALSRQNAVITLRVEPLLTWTVESKVRELLLLNGSASQKGREVIFKGQVENNTGGSISNGLVRAVLREKPGGEILAVGSTYLAIPDSAASGQILDYSFTVSLPANVDFDSVETNLIAQGQ
jgi:hypothetical protein